MTDILEVESMLLDLAATDKDDADADSVIPDSVSDTVQGDSDDDGCSDIFSDTATLIEAPLTEFEPNSEDEGGMDTESEGTASDDGTMADEEEEEEQEEEQEEMVVNTDEHENEDEDEEEYNNLYSDVEVIAGVLTNLTGIEHATHGNDELLTHVATGFHSESEYGSPTPTEIDESDVPSAADIAATASAPTHADHYNKSIHMDDPKTFDEWPAMAENKRADFGRRSSSLFKPDPCPDPLRRSPSFSLIWELALQPANAPLSRQSSLTLSAILMDRQ